MSIAVIPSLFVLLILPLLFGSFASGEPFSCDPGDAATASFPFCRTSLSILERVKDLIDRLTLEEKVKLLVNNATAVPRLGIKEYDWWSEALHGVSDSGSGVKFGGDFPGATIFPQVITTAASFNVSLWEAIGRVVSDEARAMYNGGVAGLTYWSPNVNIFRDPRWGRGQETPGEDPLVVSKYATSYVRGLQGNDNGRLKVAACCKHFTAYDIDNWNGVEAYIFNAKVSKQDMEDTFNVPFKACVMEGKVASVMCSYNQVNGVPTCADPNLLRETVRAEWGLNGYIVSDCDAVPNFYKTQNFTSNPEEAAIAAIKAGLDLECGPLLAIHTQNAVNKNLLSEAEVSDALANTLAVQMRLGMFDGEPSALPYGKLGPRDVCSPANQQLALESARQGIVLLKNHDHSLLLSQNLHRVVAVIGPNANVTETMIGNYAGVPCQYTTPLQGIGNYVTTLYQSGCTNVACTDSELFGDAIDAARLADATVLIMGLDQSIETEGRDRTELLLPGHQHDLVSDVAMASKGPTILILMSGGPIDVSFAQNNPRISAIIWVGYPGQAGGAAIADILFGAANPEGKLPMTWYPQEYVSKLPMTEMSMRPSSIKGYPGRTYRFYNGPVLYPFGYGLSYTNFFLSIASAPNIVMVPFDDHLVYDKSIKVSRARCDRLIVSLEVDVKNTGSRDGTHTLLVFHEPPFGDEAPHKQLVAFEKMQITAGTQRRIGIDINVCKYLSIVNSSGVRRIPLGQHKIHVGDIQHTISLQTVGAETASLYTGLSRFLVLLFPFVLVMVWLQRRKCLTFVKNRRWRKEDKSAIKDDEISLVIRSD